jgi:hypothetical protein
MLFIVWAVLQFNVVLDKGQEHWQFNNVLVADPEAKGLQFNNVLVA